MSPQEIANDSLAAIAKAPKKPRKINTVATHYRVIDGKLVEYDVISAPASYRSAYKYRERGKVEGEWRALYANDLVSDPKKAKAKAVKELRKSIQQDKKWLKRDEKRLKQTLKLKVK